MKMKRIASAVLAVCGLTLIAEAAYIPLKAAVAQQLLELSWSSSSAAASHRPWPWADTFPVARVRCARIGLDAVVLEGSTGRSLAFAPGHVPGTALPGESGISLIAAHRDTHFRPLAQIRVDDLIEVERPDKTLARYRVAETDVVRKNVLPRFHEHVDALVLSTCYPFDALTPGGDDRFLVIAIAD